MVIAAGCSMGAHVETATSGVATFHEQVNAGQFDAIYTAAATDFRKATTQEDFNKLLGAIAARLGKHVSSAQSGWHVNAGTGGTIVTLTFNSTFERGVGTEQFVFRIKDQKPQLLGYHIQSNDMLTNPVQEV
jgi:hypothetical protein